MPRKDEKPSLGNFLGVMLTSDSDSEIVMAARQARKLLKAEGLRWHVVPEALEQRDKLLEAAKKLKAERDQALAERDRLKQLQQANGAGNSFASQLWAPAGMPLSVDNKHAVWLLDLHAQGRHHLTPKEEGLVNSCATRRRLSDPQRNWLTDIVRNAVRRTGMTPPP
jgi:hypothetical protein